MNESIGRRFQSETRYKRGALPGHKLDWASKPEARKGYPDAPRIALSPPGSAGGMGLWEAIQRRRSVRRYAGEPITDKELSQLLWAAQGVTKRTQDREFLAAPSAGALYPIETYLVVNQTRGVEAGLYHYAAGDHVLERLKAGDFRDAIARAALDQGMAYFADCVFVWTAVFERSRWKYLERAYRYVYLDAGHVAQNLALAAVALGLGSCQIGALYDDESNAVIGVDGENESVIYMTSVGRAKE